jgi:hypothetical protein
VIFVSTSYWYLFLKDRPDEVDEAGKAHATGANR